MKLSYTIERATQPLGRPDAVVCSPLWARTPVAEVANYPWPDSGHRPRTRARLLYDDTWLAVRFDVEDQYVRAVAQAFQDPVCRDSCVELFVSPDPASPAYFNFEMNAGGVMLLRRCGSRHMYGPVTDEDGATIRVSHSMPKQIEPEIATPCSWSVEYHVPFTLFAKYFEVPAPKQGTQWKCNIYKCGDDTSHPHWGTWAPVQAERPDFHRPESFVPLLFG
jgi:hypothetical protein